MKELAKLVQIVTKRSQREAPLLDFTEKKPGKELQLFRQIQEGALPATPRNRKKTPDSPQVRMVRARFGKKLLNHLFFLNYNEAYLKVSNRYELECLSQLYQARVLIKEGQHGIAEKLLRTALKTAEETEFTNHALTAIDELRY